LLDTASAEKAKTMAGKLLSTIGVAALIAFGLGGVAALLVVKDRVTLVVQPDESDAVRGPEPLDLVRAEIATLRDDLNAFAAALGPQLEQLHSALESEGADRERASQAEFQAQIERVRADGAALASRVEALANAVERARSVQEQSFTRVEGALTALATADEQAREAALADAARRAAELARAEEERSAAAARAAERAAAESEAAATRIEQETAAAAATEGGAKKSFLSFSLPSQSFQFEGRQRLAIVPSLSRVGFDAKSTLHDFSGVTQKVEGELTVDLAAPAAGCAGKVSVDAKSLDTGLADRDSGMREKLDVQKHPQLTFEWTGFRDARVDSAAQTAAGTAVGRLSLRGVVREVAMPVRVSVDASKRIAIEGELTLKMSSFDIEPPSQLGMIKVEDDVKVWIALRARSLGAAPEAPSNAADGAKGDGQ